MALIFLFPPNTVLARCDNLVRRSAARIGYATTWRIHTLLNFHQKIPSLMWRNFFGFWRKSLIKRRMSPVVPVRLS